MKINTLHLFQQRFGAYTRQPRRVKSSAGNWWIIIDTQQGAFEFATLAEMRDAALSGDVEQHKLPF